MVQRVKNYDADAIENVDVKPKKLSRNASGKLQNSQRNGATKNSEKQMQKSAKSDNKTTVWTKVVIGICYVFGITSVMFILGSAWMFLGTTAVGFSFVIFLLSKKHQTKKESGKVFFVSLCGMVVSVLFWILFLTTRRYGIGFLSSLFRALQIAGGVLSALLILYYFVEYVSKGKFRIGWIETITEKTEQKFSHNGVER